MFSTSSIIDNLKQEKGLEYKKLCRILKISKKADKDKLDIALKALEELQIINKNKENEYSNIEDRPHIVAKIRCSSKGYCFAVRENSKEDIYIKGNLLNHAWNGDRVLVRIIKEAQRRRSPEGIVDCILERSNQILLSKVEVIGEKIYAIPIDDRILSKIILPKKDKKYKYNDEIKNIVKVKIDIFPIGQQEGEGHVIEELPLNNEKQDTKFVLSKSNINSQKTIAEAELKDINQEERIDLSDKNSFMFKNWSTKNSPILPIIHIENNKDKNYKLWIHTNAIAERLILNNRKSLEIFFDNFESFPLLDQWQNYLSQDVIEASRFNLGEVNEAISICINIDKEFEIVNWGFYLTKVKCASVIENNHLEALLTRKNKTRITSRILKPIKEYVEDLDKIIEISNAFRKKHITYGKVEIASQNNDIESINELFIHNPANYVNEYFEPFNYNDIHTYLSPLLFEANFIWFKHSNHFNLKSASYISQELDYLNISEIIKNADLLDNDIELNENGTLTLGEVLNIQINENKKRILDKLLINALKENEVKLIEDNLDVNKYNNMIIAPWTVPSYDFVNLINQYNVYSILTCGKRSPKLRNKNVNINEKESWKLVDWDIYNSTTKKNMDLLFSNYLIEKINEYKNKSKQLRSNLISIKQVRRAEKVIGKSYEGLIISVQSYGFFVEITELNVEGLVHVSTLNNDWYEYRSKQNLLIGRKSRKSYKIGDIINIKIIKVDILKYQIDLELI